MGMPAGWAVQIEVRFRSSGRPAPGGRGRLDLSDGEHTADILSKLGLPTTPCVFVVNGAAADGKRVLAEGDRVEVHPPIAGG